MLAGMEPRSLDASPPNETAGLEGEAQQDVEQAYGSPPSNLDLPTGGRQSSSSEETEPRTSSTVIENSTNFIKRKTSRLLEAIAPGTTHVDAPLPPKLAALVDAFRNSEIATELKSEIAEAEREGSQHQQLPDVALENSLTRGRQRASWGTQFTILSGRAFKNLYRNPALLAAHYISAIAVARKSGFYDIVVLAGADCEWVVICGMFFYHSGYDIPGMQNRLGKS